MTEKDGDRRMSYPFFLLQYKCFEKTAGLQEMASLRYKSKTHTEATVHWTGSFVYGRKSHTHIGCFCKRNFWQTIYLCIRVKVTYPIAYIKQQLKKIRIMIIINEIKSWLLTELFNHQNRVLGLK